MINTRDTFRTVRRGDVAIAVNSRRQISECTVDESRLQRTYTEDYVPSDTPGKPGKFVGRTVKASIEDNARAGCDAMKHRSSYKDESVPANDGNCCYPSLYGSQGPLTTKRGDS